MPTQEGSITGSQTTVASRTGGRLEERGRELGRKADALGDRVQTEVRQRGGLGEVGYRLQTRMTAAKHRVARGMQVGRARVQNEVQEHPVRTIAWAAGVGIVVGLILGRRSKR